MDLQALRLGTKHINFDGDTSRQPRPLVETTVHYRIRTMRQTLYSMLQSIFRSLDYHQDHFVIEI